MSYFYITTSEKHSIASEPSFILVMVLKIKR
jgi:hypothetical protein